MAAIEQLVRIRGTSGQVFRALTDNGEMARWFVRTECPRWRVSEQVTWFNGTVRSLIEVLEPEKLLVLRVLFGSSWEGTEIAFSLEQSGERVIVRFDHRGWDNVTDHFRDCAFNWAYFLQSLKLYVETGTGTPDD